MKTENTLMEKMDEMTGKCALRILTRDKCEVKHRLYNEQNLKLTNLPFVRHQNLNSDENELPVGALCAL